jgi:hypothetical protein
MTSRKPSLLKSVFLFVVAVRREATIVLKLKVIKYHKKREKEKETKREIGYSF